MKWVRLVGEYKERGEPVGAKVFILCGVDDSDRLLDGEWFGYDRYEDGVEEPFVLRFGEAIDFGGDPKEIQRTNIATKALRVGEYFTVASEHGGPEGWEVVCLITHVTNLQSNLGEAQVRAPRKQALKGPTEPCSSRVHVATTREIEQVKRKMEKQEKEAREKARLAKVAADYERKSNKGIKKSRAQSRKVREDIYRRETRLPGSAFSKKR